MIIINPAYGGNETGNSNNGIIEKEFNLLISKYIYDRLKELNQNVYLIRNNDSTITLEDRINVINKEKDNNTIVLTNMLGNDSDSGIEIIYSLNSNDILSNILNNNFSNNNFLVKKYYQRRNPTNTKKDYYPIQSNLNGVESIIINYGSVNNTEDVQNLKNNYEQMGEEVVKSLAYYKGFKYIPKDNNYYVVQKGDSLYSISKKYNMSVNDLKSLNNLNSNLLSIGQILLIKDNNVIDEEFFYTVKQGDSLYSISKKYNISVDDLKNANNLKNNIININERLIIPNQTIYVVKKGDSLYSISKKCNTTVESLKQKNNLKTNILSIGQQLII